jgi:hypothetical protein
MRFGFKTRYVLDAFQMQQALYQFVQFFFVVHKQLDGAFKNAVVRLDGDSGNIDAHIAGDDVGDFVDNAHIIHA